MVEEAAKSVEGAKAITFDSEYSQGYAACPRARPCCVT
jgi:hypothetical protein